MSDFFNNKNMVLLDSTCWIKPNEMGILLLGCHQAAAGSGLNLPIFGWFSSFIIRTSLKSCWDTEERVMHPRICWMTLQAVTLTVSSISVGKTVRNCFCTDLSEPSWGSWATINSQAAKCVYIWNWITLCRNMRGPEDHGASVLCKAIRLLQSQRRTKPWPTQIRTRITTPLTRCGPASRPSKHPVRSSTQPPTAESQHTGSQPVRHLLANIIILAWTCRKEQWNHTDASVLQL